MDFGDLFEKDVNPGVLAFARYCMELAGDAEMPRRSQFRPSKIRDIVSYVFLLDVLPDDYRFCLVGDSMIRLCGTNPTGRSVNGIEDEEVRRNLRSTYDLVVATRRPVYQHSRYLWQENSVAVSRLLVPMLGDDGNLTTIFGIAMPDMPDEPILLFSGRGVPIVVQDPVLKPAG